jgi:hypothetical protein
VTLPGRDIRAISELAAREVWQSVVNWHIAPGLLWPTTGASSYQRRCRSRRHGGTETPVQPVHAAVVACSSTRRSRRAAPRNSVPPRRRRRSRSTPHDADCTSITRRCYAAVLLVDVRQQPQRSTSAWNSLRTTSQSTFRMLVWNIHPPAAARLRPRALFQRLLFALSAPPFLHSAKPGSTARAFVPWRLSDTGYAARG